MNSVLSMGSVVLGTLLLLASAAWVHLFPPSRTWTEEKSQQLSNLGGEGNRLGFAIVNAKNNPSMHAGENPAELQQQYDKVREEYDVLHQEFLNASQRPKSMSSVFRWSGIVLIMVGAVMTYVGRRST